MVVQVSVGGARSKDFFDRYGDLKRIKRLKFWPLDRMLVEKYKFSEIEAKEFADFLRPILDFAPEKRPSAQQCLQHSWLNQNLTNNNSNNNDKLSVGMKNLQIQPNDRQAYHIYTVIQVCCFFLFEECMIDFVQPSSIQFFHHP